MENYFSFTKLKVILGYFIIITVAFYAIFYVYNQINNLSDSTEYNQETGRRLYLIGNTLSKLYAAESGSVALYSSGDKGGFYKYTRQLDEVSSNLDSLKPLMSDSLFVLQLDTIKQLLQVKIQNTSLLLKEIEAAKSPDIWKENVEKIISQTDSIVVTPKFSTLTILKQDTVFPVAPPKKKGFFKRLADVFSPDKDTIPQYEIKQITEVLVDTTWTSVNVTDSVMGVITTLKNVMQDQRAESDKKVLERIARLNKTNGILTLKINQMLRELEQEEYHISLERMLEKESLLIDTSRQTAAIALSALFLAFVFIIIIWRDISRNQRNRQQLFEAKIYSDNLLKSREHLMVTVSHDVKAPLSSIIGYIELLKGMSLGARANYFLDNMRSSTSHILGLIGNLLDFQKLESNQVVISEMPFDPLQLSLEIAESFRPLAESKGLDYIVEVTPTEGVLYVSDPLRLRQIYSNIVSNAVKFTSEGSISVRAWIEEYKNETLLHFQCVDTGIGIDPADRNKIFKEFSRLSSAQAIDGLGLGLTITNKLVTLLGGVIVIDGRKNKGSSFLVNIPIKQSAEQTIEESAGEEHDQDCIKYLKVLWLDDDALMLRMVSELLKDRGVTICAVDNGKNALKLLEKEIFDVVFSDIRMPGMNGFDFIRQVRDNLKLDVPVFAITANSDKEADKYKSAGFNGMLAKPFKPEELFSLLRKYCKVHTNETLEAPIETSHIPTKGFDLNNLFVYCGDDPELKKEILDTFVSETSKHADELRYCLETTDLKSGSALAHKLISVITLLGDDDLTARLRRLDKEDFSSSQDVWKTLMQKVIEEINSILLQAKGLEIE